jgi:hypothetical protein
VIGQVEAAGFRAAQAQLGLLLRHREAGDGHVQVVKGKSSSCQGTFFFLELHVELLVSDIDGLD